MIIEIESAKPLLSTQLNAKTFYHYVKYWKVKGYSWDGNCMCTKKPIDVKINWPYLVVDRNVMVELVRKVFET